jgi:hypothetical protein
MPIAKCEMPKLGILRAESGNVRGLPRSYLLIVIRRASEAGGKDAEKCCQKVGERAQRVGSWEIEDGRW